MKEFTPRKLAIIFVLSLALAIIIIDTTLLNVSLATIIQDFQTDIQSIQWVITAYSLTLAALTITGGRIGDLFGRKRMFVAGAVIFAIGSFIASISQNVPTMIVGESLVEGIGAALMMPATASLLVSNFSGKQRALAFGIWGGVAGAASAIGPIIGGFFATYYSWRWGFRINIVVALLLCIGTLIIPESSDTQEKKEIDWIGVLLSSVGMLSLVFGIIESSTYGWWKAKEAFVVNGYAFGLGDLSIVPFAIAEGLLLLVLFLIWEQRLEKNGHTPLVSIHLFQNRQYITGVLTIMMQSLGMSGLIFTLPVFLQAVKHYSPLDTGVALLPMSITILIVAPLAAFLSHKFNPKILIQAGLFISVVAVYAMREGIMVDAPSWSLVPGLALFGVGMGLVMSQINNITLSAVSVQQAGEASGVNNTFRQVGSTLGAAIIGAVMLSALSSNMTTNIQNSTVIPTSAKPTIENAIKTQTSNIEFSGGARLNNNIPPQISSEIVRIGKVSTVDADRYALVIGIIFAILGFLTSFAIPNIKPHHEEKEGNVFSASSH